MSMWFWVLLVSVILIAGGGLYVQLRWGRSPVVYEAMLTIASCYFIAGILVFAWVLHESSHLPPQFDSAAAARPDPKLTSGDVFANATVEDVCTFGWAKDHTDVTEEMRDKVYDEYGRADDSGCCEVDHLIPVELGGSNDIKNLWPQPDDPRPGGLEKDQLEKELHHLVCSGKMSLGKAQKCIASDWVKCWVTNVVLNSEPRSREANRHE